MLDAVVLTKKKKKVNRTVYLFEMFRNQFGDF